MERKERRYSDAEKLQIIDEYLASGEPMEKFQTRFRMGHCTLSRWMTNFGISNTLREESMTMKRVLYESPDKSGRERALETRLAQLEKELKTEKLKSLALNTMIDVAEEELGIDIRKKAGAKQ